MLDIEIIPAIQSRIKRRGNFISTLEEDWSHFKVSGDYHLARLTREEIKAHAEVQQIDRATLKMLWERERQLKKALAQVAKTTSALIDVQYELMELKALQRVGG